MTAVAEELPAVEVNKYCRHGGKHVYCPYSFEQHVFCAAREFEVFIGGAAGPGKTITLLADLAEQVEIPTYRGIFFRRTYVELEQVEDMAMELYQAHGGKYNSSKHTFRFPRRERSASAQIMRGAQGGATIRLQYLEKSKDKYGHQGKAYQTIAWDELTQWATIELYEYLLTRCRQLKVGDGTVCTVRSASNPGGPGHGWVKERFIGEESKHAWQPREIHIPGIEEVRHRLYIPATLDSNPLLKDQYEPQLMMISDPELRLAYRYGDWDIAMGVMFSEMRKWLHQIPTVSPRTTTSKEIAIDWGYNNMAHALWVETDSAVYDIPRSIVYREYVVNETPPITFADTVVQRSSGESILRATLDSAAWNVVDGGPSPAEQMMPTFNKAGIALVPSVKGLRSRVQGAQLLHTYLDPRMHDGPQLLIMNNCMVLWGQLTSLARGEPGTGQDPEDIAPHQVDHGYDALRYWAQGRPEPASPTAQEIDEHTIGRQYNNRDPRSMEAARADRAKQMKLPVHRDVTPKIKKRRTAWERR